MNSKSYPKTIDKSIRFTYRNNKNSRGEKGSPPSRKVNFSYGKDKIRQTNSSSAPKVRLSACSTPKQKVNITFSNQEANPTINKGLNIKIPAEKM